MASEMFSESWHRVAGVRARLNPAAEVSRQTFRGRVWHVIRDPFTNQFFRVPQAGWHFIARLRADRTVDEVWRECLTLHPEEAPGQQEVVNLLARLNQSNLLVSDLPPDVAALEERRRQGELRETRGKWMNFLFLRFALVDPQPLLNRLLPAFRAVWNVWGAVAWGILALVAAKLAVENWPALLDQSNGMFAPSNLFLFYLAGVITKSWHELGHGLVCRHYGGEVRTLGVMLLILTPLPYVDVTSSSGFVDRRQRMLVAGAGMLFEFVLATLALIFWANTGPGALHSLAYNMVVLSTVTTFVFNINPLIRFDGYYLFSDWLQIPNLGQRSTLQLKYLLERHVFRTRFAVDPSESPAEAAWLAAYGLASGIYRVVLLAGIFFLVAGQFLGIGLALACIVCVIWVVMPLGKFFDYIFNEPALESVRPRVYRWTFGTLAAVLLVVAVVPFPNRFRSQGVLEARNFTKIFAETEGRLVAITTPSGTAVKAGEVLFEMADPDLEWNIRASRAQVAECLARIQSVTDAARVSLATARSELAAAETNLRYYEKRRERLRVVAPIDGLWASPGLADRMGAWIRRGQPMGEVVDPSAFRFSAVVPQESAADLFSDRLRGASVRLNGQSGQRIKVGHLRIIPAEQEMLPSSALAWNNGGDIRTKKDDPTSLHALEPFFLVHADLEPNSRVAFYQHRTGFIRFDLKWEPLLSQWSRRLRQLFQQKVKSE